MEERRVQPRDAEVQQRLDEIEHGYLLRADTNRDSIREVRRDLQKRVSAIMLAQVLVLFSLVGVVLFFSGQHDEQSHFATRLALAVQQSRVEAAFNNCTDTSHRNAAARKALHHLLEPRRQVAKSKADLLRIQQQESAFDELFDAQLPRLTDRQCAAKAAKQTRVPLIDGAQ
jgi:hypothetical protein